MELTEHETGGTMSEVKNIFTMPNGGDYGHRGGYGYGGGLESLIALGMLSNGGFGNNRHGNWGGGERDCATSAQLQTSTGSIVDSGQNNQIMGMLQGIATSIPVAEGQVQLALAQATGQLSNQINTNLVSATQGFANTNQAISTATAGIVAVGETVKDTVNATSAQTQLGIANLATSGLQNTFALSQTITNDGDKTRALISSINDANLQRLLTVADLDRRDEAHRGRSREVEVNVTQTVNQNQMQLQAQAQQQQLVATVNGLCHLVGNLQSAVATNSNMIIGNTGATTTGAQTSSPVNVRA